MLRGSAGASTADTVLVSTEQTITGQKTFSEEVILNSISSSDSSAVTINDALNISGTLSANTIDTNTISSSDSSVIQINDALNISGTITSTGLTVDTNTLHVDSANNRVGIGTTSPAYQFEIENTGSNALLVLDRTDGAACFIEGQATRSAFGSVGATPLALAYNSYAVVLIGENGAITVNPDGDGFTLPNTDGTAGQVLQTDGSGTVSFVDRDTFDSPIALTVGSDPATVANKAHIYAKDEAASAEVFVRDEAGNVTKISPHNAQGEWEYYSRNVKTGKTVRINMEEMIRDLEKLTGKTYIKNE